MYRLILFCLLIVVLFFSDTWALSFNELRDVIAVEIRKVEKNPNIKIELSQHRDLQNRDDISYNSIGIHKSNKFVVSVFLGKKKYLLHGSFYKYIVVPVAKKRIIKGQVICEDDIAVKDLSINSLPSSAIIESSSIIGMVAKRNLEVDNSFKESDIKKRTVIARGDLVTLKFIRHNLEIEALATALDSGGVGDLIKVKIQDSSKIIVGEVIDSSTVKMRNNHKS